MCDEDMKSIHFVIDHASLFIDQRISGRPLRATKFQHFRTFWEQTCEKTPTNFISFFKMVIDAWSRYFVELLSRLVNQLTACKAGDAFKKTLTFCAFVFAVILDIREGQHWPLPESVVFAPASFLTFGKVNPGPPETDNFLGGGVPPHPPPSFLSAPASPSD